MGSSNPLKDIASVTTGSLLLPIIGRREEKKKQAVISSQQQQLAQQKAETERQAEEARIAKESVKAQKRRARMQTVFAGSEKQERPSLYKRRLGATTQGLTKTLSGNV